MLPMNRSGFISYGYEYKPSHAKAAIASKPIQPGCFALVPTKTKIEANSVAPMIAMPQMALSSARDFA